MEKKTNELAKKYELAWDAYSKEDLEKVFALNDRYIDFMSECKTERECITKSIEIAEENGYKNLKDIMKAGETLKAGDKVYDQIMGKTLAMFVIGKQPLENGMNILGAHVDSPRLDLKQNPLYQDLFSDFAMLKTHYYGGVKKYQWVTTPLAIHGVICKKDGTTVEVVIGEDEKDPVVGISDLLIHLSGDQMAKTLAKGIEGEQLNLCVGSMPVEDKDAKERIKSNVLNILNAKYDIIEEDFVSAELEVVPAGRARSYGLDSSMVMAYGHDDRVCSYTSLEAILEMDIPERTSVCLLVDKEEVGSQGATGMKGKFFENTVAEMINLMGDYNDLKLRRALANSKMLSSDVSAGYDPNYPSVSDRFNNAFFGKGLVLNKYTGARGKGGCNDANPEFIAELRNIFDKHGVIWQTSELGKVDQGGGSTIAYVLAEYGMEVIDSGVALHNMHAPWEIASKADIYEAYKGYKAFLIEA